MSILNLHGVPFTRLSETTDLLESMCQSPTTKPHATTFSGAEYIQKLEAAGEASELWSLGRMMRPDMIRCS